MRNELSETAAQIAAKLSMLDEERCRIGREGMKALARLDPDTAKMAKDLWVDPEQAVDWFTGEVESLGWKTPWQCIADGDREAVQYILNCIAYGIPA